VRLRSKSFSAEAVSPCSLARRPRAWSTSPQEGSVLAPHSLAASLSTRSAAENCWMCTLATPRTASIGIAKSGWLGRDSDSKRVTTSSKSPCHSAALASRILNFHAQYGFELRNSWYLLLASSLPCCNSPRINAWFASSYATCDGVSRRLHDSKHAAETQSKTSFRVCGYRWPRQCPRSPPRSRHTPSSS
jgi:hypothetical protein